MDNDFKVRVIQLRDGIAKLVAETGIYLTYSEENHSFVYIDEKTGESVMVQSEETNKQKLLARGKS